MSSTRMYTTFLALAGTGGGDGGGGIDPLGGRIIMEDAQVAGVMFVLAAALNSQQ